MTIVQQPDSLSFCGNLKDFIITGESEISFSLYLGSTILIAETYTAYNNKIIIPCKKVIEQQFTICLPDTDVFVQTRGVLDFNAHIGDTTVSFRVIKGGIGDAAEVATVFLKSQFLTLQPQQKQTLTWQAEFLNYYTQEQCRLKLRAYFADGTNEEKYIADLETGKLYTIDLSFLKINGKFEKQVGYYDAWIENTAGNRLTYIQRYISTHPKDNSQIYVFENTLGGLDSVCFTGLFSEKLETNGNITTINDESSDSDIDFSVIYEQNTGYIPTFEYIRWLRGFFLSCQRYHVTDSFRKIYIEESENTFKLTELNSYTFEFHYSLQSKYDFVIRNQEMLPELLEFPADNELFFLAPRLSEFPIAAIADDLVLPAQFSFENQWRRISIAAIIQAAISASIDATLDNIDLTDYWKKEELVRDELYLKFLDKKISSGYADKAGDSEKWNDKQMFELLDQPVRKEDSVQFKKVTTDEIISSQFVAGSTGEGYDLVKCDSTGKSYLEIDKIFARYKAIFAALEIRKLTYAGGNYIFSPAGMTCTRVEDKGDIYRCYFTANDGEKAVENLFDVDDLVQCRESNIKPGVYVNVSNRYYWRRCLATGDDYIDLSKSNCDTDSDIPAVGDSMATIGNKTNPARQNAIIISVYGEGSPSFIQYQGINDFTLDGKAKTIISPQLNEFTGKFIFTSGTDAEIAIGNVDKKADNAQSSANEADKKAQAAQESARQAQEAATIANAEIADMSSDSVISPVEKPALKEKWDVILSEKTKIDAQAINIGVSPDAYDNAYNALYNLIGNNLNDLTTKWEIDGPTLRSAFTNYYDARTDLLNTIARVTKEKADKAETNAGNAQKRADDAYKLSDEVNSSVDIILTSIIPDMQEQIDGNIMSWDGEQVPTLSNYPANEWTTEEEKDRHIGDTYDYYLTQDDVKVVKRYKFRKVGENYEWTPLADSDAARLEVELRETLGIANSKNSISYGSRPVPPYSIDDIWITTLKSIYVCRVQRAEGSTGLETDWELVNDTQLRLSNMASDGIISREEKPSYRNTLDQIKKEYATYNASETSVSKTALTSAYNNIVSYMTATLKVTEDSDTDITESQRNQFNVYLAAWYSSVTEFTNLIAKEEAGKAVDNLQVGGTNLLNETTLDWVDAENAAPNYYVDSVYLPQLRGKQITFSGFIKGIDAQAGSIGLEIDIAYTDGTHGYSQIFFNDRGNFEIHVQKHTLILDKEISNIKAYPIFRTGTVSGTIKVKQIQVEIGNKATDWKPSIHDQDEYAKQQGQQAVDNLQVGSQNLISKKMMLKWNEKRKDIATWGQDDDGIYLYVIPYLLFDNFSISNTIQNPIFNITFKENTQYVFSVEWKSSVTEETSKDGLVITIYYTDGTNEFIPLNNHVTSRTRLNRITKADKTVQKISSTYGHSNIHALIYNISLIEGNKPLNGFPMAEEDQTGANNVNLAEGTKNVNPAQGNVDYRYAQMYMPKIKPNTIYYVNVQNIENVTGTPTEYSFVIYNKNIATRLSSLLNANKNGGVLITSNNFSEQDGYLLCYAGVAGSTAGNTVKFTEIMLVEGFQPAQVWTPSFSEQQNAIDEAQKAADEAQSQIKEVSKTVTKLEANEESIIASVNTVIENVGNNAITAERQAFGQSWNSGKMLYTDPTFKAGVNSIGVYNNGASGSVLITRVQKQSDSPITDSDYNLEIKNQGAAEPYLGGFCWRHMSRANAIFIYRIIAKIPIGYFISYARNNAGDGSTEYFATSREGTGKWEEYIYVIRCGTGGSFSTIGYFYIVGELGTPTNPVLWYLAYASVFDMSAGISTADQAKQDAVSYTDSKTYKKYVFDLTPNTYDRNTYYPVTMTIPGSPVTTIKLYMIASKSGNPEWSTHENQVSANCIWRSNGAEWGWYTVLRDILDFSYSYSKLTPIGGIGQMVNSSNEYVYIRGGAIYYLEITNNVVPVLHTSSFTTNNETIILRESVTTPVRTNVARTEYSSKIEELDDKITERVTKTDFSASNQQVQQQIGEIVTKYNSIELAVSDINDTLGTIDISGMVTKSNFVDIFSSHKSELGETIISSISLTPDSVRIAANKIEISGETIIKDEKGNIVNIFGIGEGNVLTINDGVFNVDDKGKLTATDAVIKGTIKATNGKIGGFTIENNGLAVGSNVNGLTLNPTFLNIKYQNSYVGVVTSKIYAELGSTSSYLVKSPFYFYKKHSSDYYVPTMEIVSENAANINSALRTSGCIVSNKAIIEGGYARVNASEYTTLNLRYGTKYEVYNTVDRYMYFPTVDEIRNWVGSLPASIIIDVIAHHSNSANFRMKWSTGKTIYDWNGGSNSEWTMSKGDSCTFLLVYESASSYYAQIMQRNS